MRVRSRPDRERDSLAKALKLKAPAIRLYQLLTGDRVKPEGWILSESKSLGDRGPSDTEWRFKDIEQIRNKPDTYVFTGPEAAPALREAFLIPEGSVGTDAQFRRRLKALRALKDHDELLRMMTDPRYRIVESHDAFAADESFAKLDDSKQQALKELTSTLPLYLVQGPPGVGKTRLVRDLVRRRFRDEPTSRLLLSAQSNAALDHLMDELETVLDNQNAQDAPLIVRCGGKDGQEAPSKFDIRVQSRQLVQQLAGSELARRLPEKLQKALATLAADAAAPPEAGDTALPATRSVLGRPVPHALRAFEGAVARAANIVFATTNSGELERLNEERGQCDWAIVEEAAKATGSELVSPMLLSHRRLMIGDHKQLPPFASDQLIELLKNPDAVKEALSIGAEFVGRSLRDATTDEIVDEIEDEDEENVSEDLPRLCAEALRVLTFFESTIEAEFRRQERRGNGRPIAKKLTEQHRMHPDIASLVSRCFYDGKLTSHHECVARFQTQPRPFRSTDTTRLPITPIVVIDMPYVQAKIGDGYGERHPRWHNPAEVRAVKECIGLLAASSTGNPSPTLAVLSPYSQQVRRLDDAIRDLPVLKHFSPSSHAGTLCHTVDSFQGGEADLVVVSLVRNNAHSNIQSAFGFLSETRRMNVLLSRARWQLVLVTSLAFLDEIVDAAKGSEAENTIRFVGDMLTELREGQSSGAVSVVPFDRLLGLPK